MAAVRVEVGGTLPFIRLVFSCLDHSINLKPSMEGTDRRERREGQLIRLMIDEPIDSTDRGAADVAKHLIDSHRRKISCFSSMGGIPT